MWVRTATAVGVVLCLLAGFGLPASVPTAAVVMILCGAATLVPLTKFRTNRRQRPIPFLSSKAPRKAGVSLAVVAIKEETDPRISDVAENVTWVGIGQLGKMISFFKTVA